MDFISQSAATILAALVTAGITIQIFFIKWLIDKFDNLSSSIQKTSERTFQWLMDHEEKDASRHEDNLYRFEKIAVSLARLGSDNGTHE